MATIRNHTPESFELPLTVFTRFSSAYIVVHEVRCYSYDNFVATHNVYSVASSRVKLKGALVESNGDTAQVYFKYSEYDCGRPYRSKYDRKGTLTALEEKAFELHKDEYGRIVFNGRYTDLDTGNWWYQKKIHNIIITDRQNKDVFLNSNTQKVYEQLAMLK